METFLCRFYPNIPGCNLLGGHRGNALVPKVSEELRQLAGLVLKNQVKTTFRVRLCHFDRCPWTVQIAQFAIIMSVQISPDPRRRMADERNMIETISRNPIFGLSC